MLGPGTYCTGLTLGRQQRALFHIITFYYSLCHISVKEGDRKHCARPVPAECACGPTLLSHAGCVHYSLDSRAALVTELLSV